MSTITIKVNNSTKRGKYIIGLLREMAKTGKDIKIENVPNTETINAMKEAEAGNVKEAASVDDLFDSI